MVNTEGLSILATHMGYCIDDFEVMVHYSCLSRKRGDNIQLNPKILGEYLCFDVDIRKYKKWNKHEIWIRFNSPLTMHPGNSLSDEFSIQLDDRNVMPNSDTCFTTYWETAMFVQWRGAQLSNY